MGDLVAGYQGIEDSGTSITTMATSMSDSWSTSCDLGDETLNSTLSQLQAAVSDGLLGAAAQIYQVGQAAIDAAETLREADAALAQGS